MLVKGGNRSPVLVEERSGGVQGGVRGVHREECREVYRENTGIYGIPPPSYYPAQYYTSLLHPAVHHVHASYVSHLPLLYLKIGLFLSLGYSSSLPLWHGHQEYIRTRSISESYS